MARFTGRVGIITGAASGIGKEIATRFADEDGVPSSPTLISPPRRRRRRS
jgi:NADP-dependent 3-hydroxy acid dehydrogenase YdfG